MFKKPYFYLCTPERVAFKSPTLDVAALLPKVMSDTAVAMTCLISRHFITLYILCPVCSHLQDLAWPNSCLWESVRTCMWNEEICRTSPSWMQQWPA